MNDSSPDNVTFEQAMTELEQVVRDLEDGKIGLEESLTRYERGVSLINRCYGQLREAEQRILLLTGNDSEGQPVLQPFQHTATETSKVGEPKRPRKKTNGLDMPFFDSQS